MKIIVVSFLVLAVDCTLSFKLDSPTAATGINLIPNILNDLGFAPIQPGKSTNRTVTINGNVTVQIFNNSQMCCNKKNNTDIPTTLTIPDGYSSILKDDKYTTAVKFHPPGKTWNEARKICFAEGGFLAYPASKKEEDLYRQIMADNKVSSIWIGIHSFFEKFDFATVLGEVASEVAYMKWRQAQPDDFKGNEKCTHLRTGYNGDLNDIPCSTTEFAFICKIKLPQSLSSYNQLA